MKVCFVGIGSIAKRHIKNLSEICNAQGIELSIDALRRSSSRGDMPECIKNVFTSVADLPKDYDVIFITNPTEYHADSLIELHDHAKHFFIEKPVTSYNTMGKLAGFQSRPDSVYYVACPLRYTGVLQYIKENVDVSNVNAVRSISSSYLPDWRPGTDYRNTYSAHKDLGGGVGIDLIHEWDYLVYLFGMPDEVKSFSGKVSSLEIDSDDYAIYIAKYPNMTAELHLDYYGRETIRTVEIYTDTDTIVGDFVKSEVRFLKSGKTVSLKEVRDDSQKRELEHFIDVIKNKIPSENAIENALRVLNLTKGII